MNFKSIPLALIFFTPASYALNVVITNDDSFITHNIQQLRVALEDSGHNVILSAPCAKQSGKASSMGSYLTAMPISSLDASSTGKLTINVNNKGKAGYCIGNSESEKDILSFNDYKDGTPLQAALHGIYKANEIWGRNPDLLISGPNEGNNMGFANKLSGTLGATHAAIIKGIPAIAISDYEEKSTYDRAQTISLIVMKVVSTLISTQKNSKKLLPPLTALNINTPLVLESAKFKFTQVGWASGINLSFGDLGAKNSYGAKYGYLPGQAIGLNLIMGEDPSGDLNVNSEGNAMKAGFITISTIDAQEQASNIKTAHTENRLQALIK